MISLSPVLYRMWMFYALDFQVFVFFLLTQPTTHTPQLHLHEHKPCQIHRNGPRTTMADTTVFNVGMTCEGCANATKRILGKMEGVSAVEADVAAKKVVVTSDGATTKQAMLDALLKWSSASGKSVELASE